MWLTLAFVSAITSGILRIYEKEWSANFGNFSLGFLTKVLALPPLFVLLFFLPLPENIAALPWDFWWPLLIIWIVLYPIQTYFLYRSIREGELSVVIPVMALMPVFNIATSFFLIDELPTAYGFFGIALIVAGVYLILKTPKTSSAVASTSYNTPVVFMIFATICMAVGNTLDKVAIEASTSAFYSFVNTLGATIVFLVLAYSYGQIAEFKRMPALGWKLVLFGALNAATFVTAMFALSFAPTSYSLAVRSGAFLIPVLWGLFFLKESLSSRKIVALALFVLGTIALAIS